MENQEYQESQEIQLSDGQTDNLPPPEISQAPEDLPGDSSLTSSAMMTSDTGIYTKGEFESAFNDFLTFMKSPEVAADAFGNIHERGQAIAAQRVYELANKYRFLRFLIDKNAHLFGDLAIMSLWATVETNAILLNWTGINYLQKAKIWLKGKIKQKAAQSAAESAAESSDKRKGWGFLARPVAAKQQKQED